MFKSSIAALSLALLGSHALAQSGPDLSFLGQGGMYEVTVTNITPGQTFTPRLLVTHPASVSLFQPGEPASSELEQLAEGGDTGPMLDMVVNVAEDAVTMPGLLEPGQSMTATIRARGRSRYLSMTAMLLPTNDTFVGVNGLKLPNTGSVTYMAPAYDAGTEENDQLCANIPGPLCGGQAGSDAASGDEGFVHISNGFHDLGGDALTPGAYDWRNPVARVVVRRLR
jgi:spondin N